MREQEVEVCERCGEEREGRRRWMFYGSVLARFPRAPIGPEFYCFRCWRVMRVYAIVGFSLLAVTVGGLVGVTIWLIWS